MPALMAALVVAGASADDYDAFAGVAAGSVLHSSADGRAGAAELFAVGEAYDSGTGVSRDYRQALHWYTRAAEEGHAEAMNRIGILYATGDGVPQDYVAAVEWYRRSADRGSASAMNNIATAYFNGLGVPRDYALAARWLEPVARSGDPRAQNKLALLYENGLGVPRNHEAAFELLTRAAAQQYAPAMANLGAMYADPTSPLHDDKRAAALIEAALKIGLPDGMRQLVTSQLGTVQARLDR
jgi:TPR repeat protein